MFFFILFYSKGKEVIFGKFLFWLARDRDNRRQNNNPYNSFKHVTGSLCFGQREITNPFFLLHGCCFLRALRGGNECFAQLKIIANIFDQVQKVKYFFYKQTRGKNVKDEKSARFIFNCERLT